MAMLCCFKGCCSQYAGSSTEVGKGKSLQDCLKITYGVSLVKGKANHPMEDYHVAKLIQLKGLELGLFGIFDGHLGDKVPLYLQKHLFNNILKEEEFWTHPDKAISKAYEKTDKAILSHNPELGRGGSTAVTAILIDGRKLWIANVGDSRGVLATGREAVQLTVDHEPNTERENIETRGGFVSNMPEASMTGGGKKKRRGKSKKKLPPDQLLASAYINEWVFRDSPPFPPTTASDGFAPPPLRSATDPALFEFHCHSKCSDGFLSPTSVVERAHRNGVKVLALTDHDTMAGIPEAMEAAHRLGMLIMPGVEISSVYSPGAGTEELVHILAYYGSCGPAKHDELNDLLTSIRDGRYFRAKNMLLKLNKLRIPLEWENIVEIAGEGVAPGRLHVARAMVRAGHVENLKQAFSKYLYDGGPAYAKGSEPSAEAVVHLICCTGGVAALAHPWALKNPAAVIRSLKAAGLHAVEVYRSDGKMDGYSELADSNGLIKLGGSDFHGRGGHDESEIGSVNLPLVSICKFLKLARPIWCNAVKSILQNFAEEPSCMKLEKMTVFGMPDHLKRCRMSIICGEDIVDLCLSSWLTSEERMAVEFDAIRLKLSETSISDGKFQLHIASR